ncbi:hypothetical protein ONZ45_g7941 [Pleurotus djamor]|nr:hypothetical protein ONZ45_g7941 [Pleurotus djamor]
MQYSCLKEITESKGAVNALLFSRDGKFLLVGDDESIDIYQAPSFKKVNTIKPSNRGQVTALTWVYDTQANYLCYGTGGGAVELQPLSVIDGSLSGPKRIIVTPHPSRDDPTEEIAFDRRTLRLAVGFASGRIRMYTFGAQFEATSNWDKHITTPVPTPKGMSFLQQGQSLSVFAFVSGQMFVYDSESGDALESKRLQHAVGSVVHSSDNTFFIAHGMQSGFHMYRSPAPSSPTVTKPTRSFDNESSKCNRWIQATLDRDTTLITGTDHGELYVFDVATSERVTKLSPKTLNSSIFFQIVTSCEIGETTMIAAGNGRPTTGHFAEVVIWEKRRRPDSPEVPRRGPPKVKEEIQGAQLICALVGLYIVVTITALIFLGLGCILAPRVAAPVVQFFNQTYHQMLNNIRDYAPDANTPEYVPSERSPSSARPPPSTQDYYRHIPQGDHNRWQDPSQYRVEDLRYDGHIYYDPDRNQARSEALISQPTGRRYPDEARYMDHVAAQVGGARQIALKEDSSPYASSHMVEDVNIGGSSLDDREPRGAVDRLQGLD